MKKVFFVLFLLGIASIIVFMGTKNGNVQIYFDFLTLVVILLFTFVPLLWSGSMKAIGLGFKIIMSKDEETYTKTQLQNTYDAYTMVIHSLMTATVFGFAIGIVTLLANLTDTSTMGPMLAVVLLTILYVSIIVTLVLPIRLAVKKELNKL